MSDIDIVGFLPSSAPPPPPVDCVRPSPVACRLSSVARLIRTEMRAELPGFNFNFFLATLSGQRRASGRLTVERYPNFLPSVGQRGGLGN